VGTEQAKGAGRWAAAVRPAAGAPGQDDGAAFRPRSTPVPSSADARAEALAAEHLDLVGHVVRQVASRYPRHVDREELWSAGACGLVEAARAFKEDAGIPFVRYASIRVRGAIIDSTRSRDWAARSVRRSLRELDAAEDRFTAEHGRRPADAELARQLGIAVDELHSRRASVAHATLLQLDAPSEDESSISERLAEQSPDRLPDAALEHNELVGNLRRAIEALPDVQRDVVARSFLEGELLADIADSMGVTEARVSQIRAEALLAMRSWFGSLYEGVPEVPPDAPGKRSRAAYLATLGAQATFRAHLDRAPGDPVGGSAGVPQARAGRRRAG
jgi:RNA polymerase sigma factor FliA